jgi:hypothetical protein
LISRLSYLRAQLCRCNSCGSSGGTKLAALHCKQDSYSISLPEDFRLPIQQLQTFNGQRGQCSWCTNNCCKCVVHARSCTYGNGELTVPTEPRHKMKFHAILFAGLCASASRVLHLIQLSRTDRPKPFWPRTSVTKWTQQNGQHMPVRVTAQRQAQQSSRRRTVGRLAQGENFERFLPTMDTTRTEHEALLQTGSRYEKSIIWATTTLALFCWCFCCVMASRSALSLMISYPLACTRWCQFPDIVHIQTLTLISSWGLWGALALPSYPSVPTILWIAVMRPLHCDAQIPICPQPDPTRKRMKV